jgi:hypothetical protein
MDMADTHEKSEDLIVKRLKTAGWTRPDISEKTNWPTFKYEEDGTNLLFEYLPGKDWLRIELSLEKKTSSTSLRDMKFKKSNLVGSADNFDSDIIIYFADKLDQVLGVLVSQQSKINPDNWDHFIDQLLSIPVRIYELSGEDGEIKTELHLSDSH